VSIAADTHERLHGSIVWRDGSVPAVIAEDEDANEMVPLTAIAV